MFDGSYLRCAFNDLLGLGDQLSGLFQRPSGIILGFCFALTRFRWGRELGWISGQTTSVDDAIDGLTWSVWMLGGTYGALVFAFVGMLDACLVVRDSSMSSLDLAISRLDSSNVRSVLSIALPNIRSITEAYTNW
jgi:hypothetical protein